MAQLPDQETLQTLLHYDPDTGKLFWKERPLELFATEAKQQAWNQRYAGNEAFTAINKAGYKHGQVAGSGYYAHRVVWKLVEGNDPREVDHMDGDRQNNRWDNLREVSHRINRRNSKLYTSNSSGVPGVVWDQRYDQWQARVANKFVGRFDNFEEAVAARKTAEIEHRFHPNHGRAA